MRARLLTRNIRQRARYARHAGMPARRVGENPRYFIFYARHGMNLLAVLFSEDR